VIEQREAFRTDITAGFGTARQKPLDDWLQYWLEHVIKPNRERPRMSSMKSW
jgi:hypothetical protein